MGCFNPGKICFTPALQQQPKVLGPLVQTKLRGDLRRVLADDHAEAQWRNCMGMGELVEHCDPDR